MDIGSIIAIVVTIITVVAGIVQVIDYLEKKRESRKRISTAGNGIQTDSHSHNKRKTSPCIPYNLPPRGEFIGRTEEKSRVIDALKSRSPLVCIEGMGGIGKTSLALEVVYDCLQASAQQTSSSQAIPTFEAFVWTTAKDRNLILQDILNAIARTLDNPYILEHSDDEKLYEVIRLMQNIKTLLVLDNLETISDKEIYRFLDNLPEPSKCLVTSRTQTLPNARLVSLHGMRYDEALELARLEISRIGLSVSSNGNEDLLKFLIEATGASPLAIRWTIGQIRQQGQSLTRVLDNLKNAKGKIFESLFDKSWSLLPNSRQEILMAMSVFVSSATKNTLGAACNINDDNLDQSIAQLTEMWLLESNGNLDDAELRYSIHPLTRAFSSKKLDDLPSIRFEIHQRLIEYYISFLEQSDETSEESYDLIDSEIDNILQVTEMNLEHGNKQEVIKILNALRTYFDNRGYAKKAIEYGLKAVPLAKQLNDKGALAEILGYGIAWFLHSLGRNEEAERYANESLRLFRELGNDFRYGTIMSLLGFIMEELGMLDKATHLLEDAAETLRGCSSHPHEFAYIEKIMGDVYRMRCDVDKALSYYKNAMNMYEKSGRKRDVILVLGSIVRIELENGFIDSALTNNLLFIKKSCELRRIKTFAHGLLNLAILAKLKGKLEASKCLARESLVLFQWVGDEQRRKNFEELLDTGSIELSSFSLTEVREIIHRRCEEFRKLQVPWNNDRSN